MANHRDILADAIADAKKVKSAALANAKLVLEEAFQPTLQRMITNKLSEDGEFEGEEPDGDEVDISFEDQPTAPEGEAGGIGMGSFAPEGEPEDDAMAPEGEPETQDLELEALLRELDGEEGFEDDAMMEEEDEFGDSMEMEENTNDERQFQSKNPSSQRDQFQFEAEGDGAYEDELSEALNALLAEEEGLGDDLDMGPNKEDGSVFDETPPTGPQFLEQRKLRTENKKLKKDLNESYRAITTLKKTLNDVNLLNAKLMYTTKTFRTFNLNENQQQRILSSFDRATSVREVKLIYTTICEARNKKPVKRMAEGLASKSIKAINPTKKNGTETRANINEGQIVRWDTSRLQQLAGLKKLED